MLKSEVQHQYWITKKVVQRKLGSKEDKHIISSDAELDSKIEVYKSIAETSAELSKIIDQYQERLCILSQEECMFGRFMKEAGKRSKTTGQSITNTGKAISFAGQQRMCVRVPLLRLQHEVDVFRCRAIKDTESTLQAMEKERTEYRAALSWMKAASTELDPDTGKGLDKFRTAQSAVRAAKQNFDSYSLDSIQKIDLLAAARCNMYSHALITYMYELEQFANKAAATFETISKSLISNPKYDFCVLKELIQHEGEPLEEQPLQQDQQQQQQLELKPNDRDQSLFFAKDYEDQPTTSLKAVELATAAMPTDTEDESFDKTLLIELTKQIEDINCQLIDDGAAPKEPDNEESDFWSKIFSSNQLLDNNSISLVAEKGTTENNMSNINEEQQQQLQQSQQTTKAATKTSNAWLELFADLDPLANPQAFDLKLSGGRSNAQQT